ncbi:hypothetical protein ACFPVS_09750 [Neisseria weixii]|nr:hypothetical protein [Neisseria weixii]ATD64921.1 hypothetical protein CGZ65_05575 [Neisseria weixii]
MDIAYCVELGKKVYIDDARREFANQSLHEKFHFLCSDPCCCQENGKRTQIQATHYTTPLNESTKQTPTFKLYPRQHHSNNCDWIKDALYSQQARKPGESVEQYQQRVFKQKLIHRIDIFERPTETDNAAIIIADDAPSDFESSSPNSSGSSSAKRSASSLGLISRRSNQLENLVRMYIENKKKLSDEEFEQVTFEIPGEGIQRLCWFFRRFYKVWDNTRFNGVYIAEVSKLERFGKGFKLTFNKRIENKYVTLYMDSHQMKTYCYRRTFEDIL